MALISDKLDFASPSSVVCSADATSHFYYHQQKSLVSDFANSRWEFDPSARAIRSQNGHYPELGVHFTTPAPLQLRLNIRIKVSLSFLPIASYGKFLVLCPKNTSTPIFFPKTPSIFPSIKIGPTRSLCSGPSATCSMSCTLLCLEVA